MSSSYSLNLAGAFLPSPVFCVLMCQTADFLKATKTTEALRSHYLVCVEAGYLFALSPSPLLIANFLEGIAGRRRERGGED